MFISKYIKYTKYQMSKRYHFLLITVISCYLLQSIEGIVFQSKMHSITLRLHPNQDIMTSLKKELTPVKFQAYSLISAVGSVNYCWLRFANSSVLSFVKGPLQIVSLSGTIDKKLSPHIHIAIADGNGRTFGGHLPSLQQRSYFKQINQQNYEYDCQIFTTLQLSLAGHNNLLFQRKIDPQTTFHELFISYKSKWKNFQLI